MATSGTYTFGSLQSDQIIIDAFERIGTLPDLITSEDIQTAQRSLNLLMSEWINKGLNLWTVKQSILNLIANQNAYTLPANTSDVLEATIRTSQRRLGGTAFSSAGGVAQNAFDGNSATACTQVAPNGYISYDYGANQFVGVQMVGIQSNATLSYTLVFEYSQDNITWTQSASEPVQTYTVGINAWFAIPVPTLARYFRVRETGGATLNIQELYFNTGIQDTTISRISRPEYIYYPLKNQTGRPSSFWIDRQIDPVMYIWPTPTAQYNALFYTRTVMMEDVGAMINQAAIPQRFFEPLIAGLAYRLAQKRKPDMVEMLKNLYEDVFNHAAREDSDRVPLRIYGEFSQGWTRT